MALVAAAGSDHHVAVFFEDDVGAVSEVQHRDGMQLGGRAAGLGHRLWVYKVDLHREDREVWRSNIAGGWPS